jgi:hypothetical protein
VLYEHCRIDRTAFVQTKKGSVMHQQFYYQIANTIPIPAHGLTITQLQLRHSAWPRQLSATQHR